VPALAETRLVATIYDDGKSCPADCDAHVVYHPAYNAKDKGSAFAHLPDSNAAAPQVCKKDAPCRVCFSEKPDDCVVAIYRGGGPPEGRLDFTPAFFRERCGERSSPARASLPRSIADYCRRIEDNAARHADRINCIRSPDLPECVAAVEKARREVAADLPLYEKCVAMGEEKFNRAQASNATRRKNHCAYEVLAKGGPNSKGVRWTRLLPGACRAGAFPGKHGLDCCMGDPGMDVTMGPGECTAFYPAKVAKP